MNTRTSKPARLLALLLVIVLMLGMMPISVSAVDEPSSELDMVVAQSVYGWVSTKAAKNDDGTVTVGLVPVGGTEEVTYTTAVVYDDTNADLEGMAPIDEANVIVSRVSKGSFAEVCLNAAGEVIDVRRVLQSSLFFDTAEFGGDLTKVGSTVKHRGAEGTGIMTGSAGNMVASGWILDKADGKLTLGDGNKVTNVFIEEYAVAEDVAVYEIDNSTYASTQKAISDVPVTPSENGVIYDTASDDRVFAIVVFDSDYTAYDAGTAKVKEIYYFADAISNVGSYVGLIPENNRVGSDLSSSTQGSPKPNSAPYLTSAVPFTIVDGLMWSTGDNEALNYLFYGKKDGNYTLTRFDTGWPKAGYQYWKNDEAALADLGLDSRDITRVLLSHGHSDHYGTSFDLWEMIVRANEDAATEIYETYEDGVGYDKYGFPETKGALPTNEYAFRSVITNWYDMDNWLELGEGLSVYPTLTPGHTAGVASCVYQVTVGEGGMKDAHLVYNAETGERTITDYQEGDELFFIYMGGYGINGLNNPSTGYLRPAFASSLRYLQSVLPYLKTSTGQAADGIYNLPQHTNQFPYMEVNSMREMYNEKFGTDYPFLHFLREGAEEVANFAEKRASAIMTQEYDAKYEEMVSAQGKNPYDTIEGIEVKIDATNADPTKLYTVEESGPFKHEGGETLIQIAEDVEIIVHHGYDVFLNKGVVAEDAGIINSASSGGSAKSDFNVSKGFLFAKDGFVYDPDSWFVQIGAHVQDDYDGNVYSNTGINEGITFTSGPVESYHGKGWSELIRTEGMTKAEAEALAASLEKGAYYKVNLKKTGDIINAENVMDTFVLVEEDDDKGGSSGGTSKPSVNPDPAVPEDTDLPFTDVDGHWAEEAIAYVYENEIMNGMTTAGFYPNVSTTRGMIVTMLYRLAGSPAVSGESKFDDVAESAYYHDAVVWAASKGIVKGVSDTSYAPDAEITREQLATMLYNYCKFAKYSVSGKADISGFADAGQVSSWAADGLEWAVAEKLVQGVGQNSLDPAGKATRAQVATLFMRFMENVAK